MDVSKNAQSRLRISLFLAALGGIFSLGWLLMIPSERGMSIFRLGMIFFLSAGILVPLAGLTPAGSAWLCKRSQTLETDSVTNRRRI